MCYVEILVKQINTWRFAILWNNLGIVMIREHGGWGEEMVNHKAGEASKG